MSDRFYSRFNIFKGNNGQNNLNFSEFDSMSDDDDNLFLSSFNTNGGVAFNSYYIAILNQAASQGFAPPSSRVQILQNDLIDRLVKYDIWDKLDILYVFAQDGDQEFGLINWKNPSGVISATLVNSPTFVINGGFRGNGTDNWIDTNFNPATQGVQYTQNNASRYFFTHAIGLGRFDGNSSGVNSFFLGVSASQRINAGSNLVVPVINYNSTANTKSIHRTSSSAITAYNSTTAQIGVQTSASITSANQLILRSSTNYSTHTCAGYAMGASLISPLNDNFVGSWDIYQTAL